MSSFDFHHYPKTPRLDKMRWDITEKIDGTNGAICFFPLTDGMTEEGAEAAGAAYTFDLLHDAPPVAMFVGSRNRWLKPGKYTDNFGFAGWAREHWGDLYRTLGYGRHVGEWWGLGIQRGYGQDTKRFSLFDRRRYHWLSAADEGHDVLVSIVPSLGGGDSLSDIYASALRAEADLKHGSLIHRGTPAEGFVLTIGEQRWKHIINETDKTRTRG